MKTPRLTAAIYLLTMAIVSKNTAAGSRCPALCICADDDDSVRCEEKQLAHLPVNLPNTTKLLALPNNKFSILQARMFEGKLPLLQQLVLFDNQIRHIAPGSFVGLKHLKDLWLFNNRLDSLSAGAFGGLPSLDLLDLSRNRLEGIEPGTFAGLGRLRVLDLWGNNLTHLQPGTFSGADNLKNLTLGDNNFTSIPTAAFQNLHNLTTLELLNLPVRSVEPDAFSSLTNLHRLHLGHWPLLARLDARAFRGLKNLVYLSLHACGLHQVPQQAFAEVPNLKQLLLSNNPINRLGNGAFKALRHLEELYISGLGIHTIHESPFRMMTSLHTLDLSKNNIAILPHHVFFQLENLRMLNVSYNNVKTLPQAVVDPLLALNEIDLTGNPLICDCKMKWLKYLQETKIRQHFSLLGKCTNPRLYNGTAVAALSQFRFACKRPLFRVDNLNVSVMTRTNAQAILNCDPDEGIPQPAITWTIPKHASKAQNKVIMADGSLLIKRVAEVDYGTYSCLAVNEYGNATRFVVLLDHVETASKSNRAGPGIAVAVTVVTLAGIAAVGFLLYRRQFGLRRSLYEMFQRDEENTRLSRNRSI